MNKTDLIDSVAAKTKMTKKASEQAINAVFGSMEESLAKQDKVQIIGFGTFEVRKRAQRKGRNPQTGESIQIPARRVPGFKAGKELRARVNIK